jgi:hypothetical protein
MLPSAESIPYRPVPSLISDEFPEPSDISFSLVKLDALMR